TAANASARARTTRANSCASIRRWRSKSRTRSVRISASQRVAPPRKRPLRSRRGKMSEGERRDPAARPRAEPSLKSRALRCLSRREYSRSELARKLAPHAESAEQLDTLLDRPVQAQLLSDERFAESLVHRRAQQRGASVIRHELRAHHLDDELVAAHVAELARSEHVRARALWKRRFGTLPTSTAERARQSRFLLSRGFSAEVV